MGDSDLWLQVVHPEDRADAMGSGTSTELWLPLRAPVAGETPIRPS